MEYFVKDTGKNRVVYKSLLIETPKSLGILANKTAMDLVKELSLKPLCAMDLARRLGLHEQKVYYNLRKLEKAGIIKLLKTEERTGGTAKIFTLAEPVVSVKLAENAFLTNDMSITINNLDFLIPFVNDGKLNAKIIIGDPYSHGKYDVPATEAPHIFDFALLLGGYLKELNFPNYILDTEVTDSHLKNNLILFGNNKTNTVIDKINSKLPVYFDKKTGFLVSNYTNKTYKDPRVGVILRFKNPFNKKKEILIFGGLRSRGIRAAIIAFTQHIDKITDSVNRDGSLVKIVQGYDKNGDRTVDSIKFLE
jgi:DNA-binding transcriptional ArsR family regulator